MDEFFTIVGHDNPTDATGRIRPYGCVARALAHSSARIPHATVQVFPVRCRTGDIVLHQRSARLRNSPSKWDVLGGHVTFEMGILLSPNGLEEASVETALRETQEEMLASVGGTTHLFQKHHLRQIGSVGQFEHADDRNVERSTAFAVYLPESAALSVPLVAKNGELEWLPFAEVSWTELLHLFGESTASSPSRPFAKGKFGAGFADGVSRILKRATEDPTVRSQVVGALDWCRDQTF